MLPIGTYYGSAMPKKHLPNVVQSSPGVKETEWPPPLRIPGALMESIDLNQIRCFVAAYEANSVRMRSHRARFAQPGLYRYIQRLGAMLDQRLFHPTAR